MSMIFPFLIITVFVFLINLIFYKGINRLLLKNHKPLTKRILIYTDIAISLILLLFLIFYFNQIRTSPNYISFTKAFYSISFFILFLIPKIQFLIFLFINNSIRFIIRVITRKKSNFRIISYIGLFLGIFIFVAILYGMIFGKNDFTVKSKSINFSKLPLSFNSIKIVQISDLHIGSFCNDTASISKAVTIINGLNPDIVFLTGDLVNNFAEEANDFDNILSRIKAPLGKYAVLGNHDFGDYTVWRTPKTKDVNLNDVIDHYQNMGFKLLRNEHVFINKGNDSIAIAGVDSWGLPPFRQYGDVNSALKNIPKNIFTILLSHDPSYWNSVIKFNPVVNITFSGHTHGMQLGIEKFGLSWSPVKYRYPQWGGLYNYNAQYLYVNRGLGFIGFTGRIGMPPEITVVELLKK